jgi:hypothetical protein
VITGTATKAAEYCKQQHNANRDSAITDVANEASKANQRAVQPPEQDNGTLQQQRQIASNQQPTTQPPPTEQWGRGQAAATTEKGTQASKNSPDNAKRSAPLNHINVHSILLSDSESDAAEESYEHELTQSQ